MATLKELLTKCIGWNFSRHGEFEPANDQLEGQTVMRANEERMADPNDPYHNIWFLPASYDTKNKKRVFDVPRGVTKLFILVATSHATKGELTPEEQAGNENSIKQALVNYAHCVDKAWRVYDLSILRPGATKPEWVERKELPAIESDFVEVDIQDTDRYAQLTHGNGAGKGSMMTVAHVHQFDISPGIWKIWMGATSQICKCGKVDERPYIIDLEYTLNVLG